MGQITSSCKRKKPGYGVDPPRNPRSLRGAKASDAQKRVRVDPVPNAVLQDISSANVTAETARKSYNDVSLQVSASYGLDTCEKCGEYKNKAQDFLTGANEWLIIADKIALIKSASGDSIHIDARVEMLRRLTKSEAGKAANNAKKAAEAMASKLALAIDAAKKVTECLCQNKRSAPRGVRFRSVDGGGGASQFRAAGGGESASQAASTASAPPPPPPPAAASPTASQAASTASAPPPPPPPASQAASTVDGGGGASSAASTASAPPPPPPPADSGEDGGDGGDGADSVDSADSAAGVNSHVAAESLHASMPPPASKDFAGLMAFSASRRPDADGAAAEGDATSYSNVASQLSRRVMFDVSPGRRRGRGRGRG